MLGPMTHVLLGALVIIVALSPTAQSDEFDGAREAQYEIYRVVNVRGLDMLNVRAGPQETARKIGEFSFNARDIFGLGRCTPGWCLVSYGDEVIGWVSRRYIATDNGYDGATYSVVGLSKYDVLTIRDKPSSVAEKIGAIPPFEITVEALGGCVRDWCPVGYRSMEGWVHRKHLAVWLPAEAGGEQRIGGF